MQFFYSWLVRCKCMCEGRGRWADTVEGPDQNPDPSVNLNTVNNTFHPGAHHNQRWREHEFQDEGARDHLYSAAPRPMPQPVAADASPSERERERERAKPRESPVGSSKVSTRAQASERRAHMLHAPAHTAARKDGCVRTPPRSDKLGSSRFNNQQLAVPGERGARASGPAKISMDINASAEILYQPKLGMCNERSSLRFLRLTQFF
jgi:hypothetical protein